LRRTAPPGQLLEKASGSRCSTPPSLPALRAEHPAVDDVPLDPDHDIVPSLLTAHLLVSRCSELRSLLDLYAAALRRCVRFEHDDHLGPF
jgi:hypothetical protein